MNEKIDQQLTLLNSELTKSMNCIDGCIDHANLLRKQLNQLSTDDMNVWIKGSNPLDVGNFLQKVSQNTLKLSENTREFEGKVAVFQHIISQIAGELTRFGNVATRLTAGLSGQKNVEQTKEPNSGTIIYGDGTRIEHPCVGEIVYPNLKKDGG